MGGVWNERHEGPCQRRHQSLGVGWLVGGSLHARSGVGTWRRQGTWRRSRLGRRRSRRALLILEQKVIPEFYTRDKSGVPIAWVNRMRESMARLAPRFSANRTVREYTEQHYFPRCAYKKRIANKGAMGRKMVDWQQSYESALARAALRRSESCDRLEGNTFSRLKFIWTILTRMQCRVELYADGINGSAPVRQEMQRVRELAGASGSYVYSAAVPAARPPADYTARVIPHCDGVAIPLEDARILWQR